ncbi:MFS general substrate transporter [Trichoderma velutinum]
MVISKIEDTLETSDVEMIENYRGVDSEVNPDENAYQAQTLPRTDRTRAEKTLLLKADLCIVPLAALAYLVSYLDRNDIGNARLMGWQKSINMTNSQFSTVSSLFFVGYILFMFPANILVRYIQPQRMIGSSIVIFGVLVLCLSAAKNYGTVLAIRILIGCFQCSVQAFGIYTPYWYQRNELATRAAAYYSAATLSGAFSGLIAYGVEINLDGVGGRRNWQWLFIIEGALAVEIANRKAYNALHAKIEVSQIWRSFKDPKTYFFAILNVGNTLAISSVGIFLPTFIQTFGFSPVKAQLFSVIPYACAFFSLITICTISDRLNVKFIPIICLLSITLIGYILLITLTSTSARIVATCLVVGGAYPTVVLIVTWIGINTAGFTKRAATWSVAEICSNSVAIMGPHVYTNAPRFINGHSIVIGFTCSSIIMASCAYLYMAAENTRRDKVEQQFRERGETHPDMNQTLEQLCDSHISFRYTL